MSQKEGFEDRRRKVIEMITYLDEYQGSRDNKIKAQKLKKEIISKELSRSAREQKVSYESFKMLMEKMLKEAVESGEPQTGELAETLCRLYKACVYYETKSHNLSILESSANQIVTKPERCMYYNSIVPGGAEYLRDLVLFFIKSGKFARAEYKRIYENDIPPAYKNAYEKMTANPKKRSKADMINLKELKGKLHRGFTDVYDSGDPPSDPMMQEFCKLHKKTLMQMYYSYSKEAHMYLAHLIATDPEYGAEYESCSEGLADFLCDALMIFCKDKSNFTFPLTRRF